MSEKEQLARDIASGVGDDREGWYGAAEALSLARGYLALAARLETAYDNGFKDGRYSMEARLETAERERDGAVLESDERAEKWMAERERAEAAEAQAAALREALQKIRERCENGGALCDTAHGIWQIARAALAQGRLD